MLSSALLACGVSNQRPLRFLPWPCCRKKTFPPVSSSSSVFGCIQLEHKPKSGSWSVLTLPSPQRPHLAPTLSSQPSVNSWPPHCSWLAHSAVSFSVPHSPFQLGSLREGAEGEEAGHSICPACPPSGWDTAPTAPGLDQPRASPASVTEQSGPPLCHTRPRLRGLFDRPVLSFDPAFCPAESPDNTVRSLPLWALIPHCESPPPQPRPMPKSVLLWLLLPGRFVSGSRAACPQHKPISLWVCLSLWISGSICPQFPAALVCPGPLSEVGGKD